MTRFAAALLLAALCVTVQADPPDASRGALADLPSRWASRLEPIPPQRLDELDPAKSERIRDTRAQLDTLLAGDAVDDTELAGVFGRLGALYGAHRMFAGAELALHNARVLDPRAFRWAYYAAHIALEQGNTGQALALLDVAAGLDPDYPALALRRGEALLGLNRLDAARAAFGRVVDVPELRAAALYGLGQIDLLERDWQQAAARLGEVLAMQPQADAVNYPYGQALVGLGRRDEARAHLARTGEVKPYYADPLVAELRSLQVGARYRFEQGVLAVRRRDFAAAAEAFGAGLVDEPANVLARTSHARALWLSGQQLQAEQELRRATADGPDAPLPHFLLAVVRDADGDSSAAADGYRAVLAMDPSHAGALSYLADLELRRGDPAAAAADYERAVAAGVREAHLYLHYRGALRDSGADDSVLRAKLEAFDHQFPEPPVFRYLLARLLATSNVAGVADAARAVEIARALHAADPAPPHTGLLALALAAGGDFAKAGELQQELVGMAQLGGAWLQVAALQGVADDYRDGRLPEPSAAAHDPLFMPPPVDVDKVMLNYPAGRPY